MVLAAAAAADSVGAASPLPSRSASPTASLPAFGLPAEPGSQLPSDPAAGDAPSCRICFSPEEPGRAGGRLLQPCMCSGSMAFVHEGCLAEWIANKKRNTWRCEICGCTYWRLWCKELAPRLPPKLLACGLALGLLAAGAPLRNMAAAAGVPGGPAVLVAAATLMGVLGSG